MRHQTASELEPERATAETGSTRRFNCLKKEIFDYIVFECLAERTIAIAQKEKLEIPSLGYNHMLLPRMERILPLCRKIGNEGYYEYGSGESSVGRRCRERTWP